MIRYLNKSLADIRSNLFLNLITMVTISLCILVVSLFLLLFQNLGRIMDGWGSEGRAMVYLAPGFTVDMQSEVESALLEMEGISRVFFCIQRSGPGPAEKRDGRFQPVSG